MGALCLVFELFSTLCPSGFVLTDREERACYLKDCLQEYIDENPNRRLVVHTAVYYIK